MAIKKETELIRAVIVYCQRCQDEGDLQALQEMGFGAKELRVLTRLSATDTLRLASARSHFCEIKVNRETYWRTIDFLKRDKDKEHLIDTLISYEAPPPLMNALTGMSNKEYSLRRRQFGFTNCAAGRPVRPSDDIAKDVWQVVKNVLSNSNILGPKEFLNIFDELDKKVSLRIIWCLVNQWDKNGQLRRMEELMP